MFCTHCGKEIQDSTKFCPYCGSDCSAGARVAEQAKQMFNGVEQEIGSAVEDVKQTFNNSTNQQQYNGQQYGGQQQYNGQQYNGQQQYYDPNQGQPYGVQRLKTDRGLASYILLTIITCGIYSYYFIWQMAHDVNIACEGDGESTSGLAAFILLSIVTCGIYAWVWYYKLGNRLCNNAGRYGLQFQENGTTVLMWLLLGSLICGIGQFVAMNILIKNTNAICNAYNRYNGIM